MFYCKESAPSYVLTTESTIQSVRSTWRQCSYPWNVPFDGAYSSALDTGRVIPAVITSFPHPSRHSRVGGNLDARSYNVPAAARTRRSVEPAAMRRPPARKSRSSNPPDTPAPPALGSSSGGMGDGVAVAVDVGTGVRVGVMVGGGVGVGVALCGAGGVW